MGSLLPTFHLSTPEVYSYSRYQTTVAEINTVSNRLAQDLNFDVTVHSDTLCFNYTNWKKSTAKATLGLGPSKIKKLMEEEDQKNESLSFEYQQEIQIILDMHQVYEAYDLLKYFKKQENMNQSTPITPSTPTEEQKSCEICFNEEPDLALPCGHRFGPNCISQYIIDKQEKMCPMCRRQFLGRKSQIQRDLYTVIEKEDKYIYQEIKTCLIKILKRGNEKSIKNLEQFLNKKN